MYVHHFDSSNSYTQTQERKRIFELIGQRSENLKKKRRDRLTGQARLPTESKTVEDDQEPKEKKKAHLT